MSNLYRSLAVTALAIAVNPVPILAAVTLLTTRHGKRSALAFLVTLVVIMLSVGVLMIWTVGSNDPSGGSTTKAGAALQLVFGLAFLVMAFLQWRTEPGVQPAWMDKLDDAGIFAAVVLGLGLTNYALVTSGAATILKSGSSTATQMTALVYFVAIAVSTVAAILILATVAPHWSARILERLRAWLMLHSRMILIVVFGLMGALFAGLGIYHLVQ